MGLVFQTDKNKHLQSRESIIVWLKKASDQYKLRHYGDIIYFSRKKNYVILYCDLQKVPALLDELNNMDFVKKAEQSRHDELDFSPEYEENMMNQMKEKAEKIIEEREDLRF